MKARKSKSDQSPGWTYKLKDGYYDLYFDGFFELMTPVGEVGERIIESLIACQDVELDQLKDIRIGRNGYGAPMILGRSEPDVKS